MRTDNITKVAILSVAIIMLVYAWLAYRIANNNIGAILLVSTFFIPILIYGLISIVDKIFRIVVLNLLNLLTIKPQRPYLQSIDQENLDIISLMATFVTFSIIILLLLYVAL